MDPERQELLRINVELGEALTRETADRLAAQEEASALRRRVSELETELAAARAG